ncbi:MAG: N-formylglutamate amidohydrolase [Cyclobacteriaceae bacterium]
MDVFRVIKPAKNEVPVVISSPHSGSFIPKEIKDTMYPALANEPDDTDWFIDELYDFAPEMGITMICANYSRWVIDLNRDPQSKPLYTDGRVITGLVPRTTFNGEPLYQADEPDESEVDQRLNTFYMPYHTMIRQLLAEKLETFGKVLLFDAHSIRKRVPGIRNEPFPDLILGDNDWQTASPKLSESGLKALESPKYELSHNHPFRGGYITRNFGRPENNIHALQLEMAKTNYMDDSERNYDLSRAGSIRKLLSKMFEALISELK